LFFKLLYLCVCYFVLPFWWIKMYISKFKTRNQLQKALIWGCDDHVSKLFSRYNIVNFRLLCNLLQFGSAFYSQCRKWFSQLHRHFLTLTLLTLTITLTYDPDLRTRPRYGQDDPASQISRSKVISIENYCPATHSHIRPSALHVQLKRSVKEA